MLRAWIWCASASRSVPSAVADAGRRPSSAAEPAARSRRSRIANAGAATTCANSSASWQPLAPGSRCACSGRVRSSTASSTAITRAWSTSSSPCWRATGGLPSRKRRSRSTASAGRSMCSHGTRSDESCSSSKSRRWSRTSRQRWRELTAKLVSLRQLPAIAVGMPAPSRDCSCSLTIEPPGVELMHSERRSIAHFQLGPGRSVGGCGSQLARCPGSYF